MFPQKQRQRLRFVHLGWLGMIVAAALGTLLSRESVSGSFAWLGLAALPGLAGVLLLGRDRQLNHFAPPFLVITWTVFATFALALGGAAVSPLTVLLVIAPLVALNLGHLAMAAEAAFFGACAYFAALVLVRLGFLPTGEAFAGFAAVSQLIAFAALVLAGLLVWFMVHEYRRVKAQADEAPAPMVSELPKPVLPVPSTSGVLLLDVTLDGLVRSLSGDRMGLVSLGAGTLVRDVFGEGFSPMMLQTRAGPSRGELNLSNGHPVRYAMTPHPGGAYLVLTDRTDAVGREAEAAAALDEAGASLKRRTAFFASLGHDLKTPLNAIIGYADMMR
ncbi:MAG: hypothetical protein KDA43_09940, partial [Hyphomonas sp.]|nr:hypothetical protein [Hyphomonas sp.]